MAESGSLIRHAARAACLTLFLSYSAGAQEPVQPIASPAPDKPGFLTRGDFQLAGSALADDDVRFQWDTHWGGSFDMVDYVAGRIGVYANYEAVCGNELRPFDPNQGNYTLEVNGSARVDDTTEIVGIFHHVSRHLSDRPKRFAVAMNLAGVRALKRFTVGTSTIDVDLEGGGIVARAFVDYTWIAELHVQARHPLSEHVAVFGRGMAQWIGTDGESDRGVLSGGFFEGGIRLKGGAATMELFAGFERRVDADPVERVPMQWALAGVRLLSR